MGSVSQSKRLLNYPEPLRGPDVPYVVERKSNPPIRGWFICAAALILEYLRFVREIIWRNAGFGDLRKIRPYIEDYEPWFEPQIVPYPEDVETTDEAKDDIQADEIPETEAAKRDDIQHKYPQAKYYSVDDYRKLYLSGALTPLDVAQALLPLIRRDVENPTEYSSAWFDSKAEKVLAAARASTQRYKEGRSLGPLDGVPTGVKDEYDMDGYETNLGSKNIYTGEIREQDSITTWCVRKLEEAGALILGKLSMHEFGLDTTGNNPIHGTPRNPHNPNYYTGGSSSGTGYAVSAGLIPIGLGSDGGGSIRIPSSLCGVFGLKPTHGRLSFKPGQNHCLTCACLGPIAADIKSLATVFQVICKPHPSSPFPPLKRLSLTTPSNGSSPKILGIPSAWFARATPAIQTLCNTLIRRLCSDHGYTAVEIDIPFLPQGQIAHAITVLTDAATLLPETSNLTYGNRILIALGTVTPASDYMLAMKLRRVLMQHLSYLWQQYPGMLIVTPTTSCEGLPIHTKSELKWGVNDGDRTLESMEYVWLANFCGLPSISVPAGFVDPLQRKELVNDMDVQGRGEVPVGLMAMGEWCAEEQLLQFGAVVEEAGADRRRRPPIWVDVVKMAKEGAAVRG
ncbi:amidase signature domain-containing protein [Sordaria brevicollis]|uniref:Amidase signature domain-containing protein n=1 Tax=Sordaria brevicollis TaxID=83679 RepID=A0AAE0UF94_SORBR|nr:amidase signature domain-containing protein [Sordaria brevicollis]